MTLFFIVQRAQSIERCFFQRYRLHEIVNAGGANSLINSSTHSGFQREISMAMNRTNQHIVMATFSSSGQAEQAIEALHDKGFTSDQIRYSGQFVTENFLESVKDLLIFPNEAQNETQDDIMTMLQNMGIGQDEITYYMNEFKRGQFVVVVRPDGRDQEATRILQSNGGTGYRQ